LHFEVVFLLQVSGLAFEFLPQFGLSFVVFCFEGEDVVFLAEFLFLEGDVECSYVCFEGSFLDAVFVFELFEGDFDVLPEFALLVLVDEHDMFDSGW
jgi:hypothetical protein